MTEKERVIRTVLAQPTDRVPFIVPFGPWGETLRRWQSEGMPKDADFQELAQADCVFQFVEGVNLGLCPAFEPRVLEHRGNKNLVVDSFGITQLVATDHDTIPQYLDYPVKDWDSWMQVKERWQKETPERFSLAAEEFAQKNCSERNLIQLGWYPYGLFGTARDLIGVEDLLLDFYDQPELLVDIMDTLTDLWLSLYEKVCAVVKVDCIHIWEDMSGKSGPLISPAMMEEFLVPRYRKIRDFCDAHAIPILSLDTDGDCSLMIPPLLKGGINLLYPFEVAAGSDLVAIKQQYPTAFCAMGGIDKRPIALSEYEIDKELERIQPSLEYPAVIPALDHLFHPEISYHNFLYFCKRLKKLCEESRPTRWAPCEKTVG